MAGIVNGAELTAALNFAQAYKKGTSREVTDSIHGAIDCIMRADFNDYEERLMRLSEQDRKEMIRRMTPVLLWKIGETNDLLLQKYTSPPDPSQPPSLKKRVKWPCSIL